MQTEVGPNAMNCDKSERKNTEITERLMSRMADVLSSLSTFKPDWQLCDRKGSFL